MNKQEAKKQRQNKIIGIIILNSKDIIDRLKSTNNILSDLSLYERKEIFELIDNDIQCKALDKEHDIVLDEFNKLTKHC